MHLQCGMPSKMSLRVALIKAAKTYQFQPTSENLKAVHKAATRIMFNYPANAKEALVILDRVLPI
ncbi:MAG: hypothetical protein NVS1B11_32280 [Terriglobales bacterium]